MLAAEYGVSEAYFKKIEEGHVIQSKCLDNFLRLLFNTWAKEYQLDLDTGTAGFQPDFERIGYMAAMRWVPPLTDEQERKLYSLFGRR